VGDDAVEFQRIKNDGANAVSFLVAWQVPSYSSSTVSPGPYTDSDADVLAGAAEAHQAGLKVTMTPKVLIGVGGWQGSYNPPDPATFFAGYQTMVDHYASLSQQAGASMYLVGSEMIASDGYVGYWRQIVAAARQRFSGPIGYESDWSEISQFSWGDAVDVVLLSAYFPLSNEQYPTLAQLEWGWHSYQAPGQSQVQDAFSQVAGFARRWNKPIIFGEAGYMATTYPANEPAHNVANPPAPELQYLAYKALLDTFATQPWWGGIMWWAWNDGDPRSPENKPAEGLIGAQSVAAPVGPGPGSVGGSPGSHSGAAASTAPPSVFGAAGLGGNIAVASSPGPSSSTSPSDRTPQQVTAASPASPPRSGLVRLRETAAGYEGVPLAVALVVLVLGSAVLVQFTRIIGLASGAGRIGRPPLGRIWTRAGEVIRRGRAAEQRT
jgi:hypothetical protein